MRKKVWRTLEATSLLAIGGLAACSEQAPSAPGDAASEVAQPDVAAQIGEGAGEGEGVADSALTAANDVAYLTQIGLMRGHLLVGNELFTKGHQGMATTHMKHPKAELYSSLEDAFAARAVPGFAAELSTLTDRVSQSADATAVAAAYSSLQTAIHTNEQGANTSSAKIIGEVIVGLLRTAGDEYAIGVVDGAINNLHEYQDAFGFTRIAMQWAKSPAFARSDTTAASAARIQNLITELDSLWPDLAPTEPVPGKAAQLYGAAARIEIETLGL